MENSEVKMTANEPTQKIGEWRLISTLGAGSFGTVTLWRHLTTNQEIAIKKCKFHHPTSVTVMQRQRWQAEVAFMQTIQHPNIVKCLKGDPHLLDVMHNPTKLPMMCMEYCRRGNLRHYLQNEPIRMCGLPEPDVRNILSDVSCGLSYLHSKMAERILTLLLLVITIWCLGSNSSKFNEEYEY